MEIFSSSNLDNQFNEAVPIPAPLKDLREKTKVVNNLETGDKCSICQEIIEENDIIRILGGCNHKYHLNCIDKWFETI